MSIRYCGLAELAASRVLAELVPELQGLLDELGDEAGTATAGNLVEMINDPDTFGAFAICETDGEERIVGMGILNFVRLCAGKEARIDEVCVDARYRRKGIGDEIVELLLAQAREKVATFGELTCSHHREAAGKLYVKKGFRERRTRVYVIDPLSPEAE